MRHLSTFLKLVLAVVGVVAGLGLSAGVAAADELPVVEPTCLPEASVLAPLGAGGALPTARLVEGPDAGAPAVPGGWAPTIVDGGSPTTATWSVPVVDTTTRTVWVVDGDAPAFPLTLLPGCRDAGVAASLVSDCATGTVTAVVSSWDQDAVVADVTGAVTASLPVPSGAELTVTAPAEEDTTAVAGVTVGRIARIVVAGVDCQPPPAAPVAATETPDALAADPAPVADAVSTAAVLPPGGTGTKAAAVTSAAVAPDGPAPLVAVTQEAPRQVEPTQAEVTQENARVEGQGAAQVPATATAAVPAAPSLAMTGTDTIDLLQIGFGLAGAGFALERLSAKRLGRPIHFAANGGNRAA